MSEEEMERLAAKYEFRFIGASTIRRLAESFVSIYTGQASAHPVAHMRQDFSAGNLKVIFDWNAFCAGESGVGVALTKAMDEHKDSVGGAKRLVVITAYGIHDATLIMEYQGLNHSAIVEDTDDPETLDMYAEARERGVLARDAYSNASFASCQQLTSELIAVARDGTVRPKLQPLWDNGLARHLVLLAKSEGMQGWSPYGQGGAVAPDADIKADRVKAPWLGEERSVTWDNRTNEATSGEVERSIGRSAASTENRRGAEGNKRRLGSGSERIGRRRVQGATRDGSNATEENAPELTMGKSLAGRGANEVGSGREDSPLEVESVRQEEKHLSPLVFVFQGNPFLPSDRREPWLTELRDMQRRIFQDEFPATSAESRRTGATVEGEVRPEKRDEGDSDDEAVASSSSVYLVEDHTSLFRRMECYRGDEIHFLEPAKLIEAKMLWDLLALADRG